MASAATSWARAAISAVGNVPSHMRDFLRGSRISDTHLPHVRIRTPRNVGCFPSLPRGRFLAGAALLPAQPSSSSSSSSPPASASASASNACRFRVAGAALAAAGDGGEEDESVTVDEQQDVVHDEVVVAEQEDVSWSS
uniref:Transcription factor DREB1 n=1 Tax=Zea mays TaxID=4577 RepID=A0A1Y0DJH7_MAIZE|nr:transcription factor DREB1 [Zea mays]